MIINEHRSRRYYLPALVLACSLLHGCAWIYTMVDFEVLEPATVSFPPEVKQLIILNRAPVTMDVLEEEDREGMNNRHLFIIDTLIINNLNKGLLAVLQQSPIEMFQKPVWISERRRDTAGLKDLILTRREVEDLCSTHRGDAVISLESYTMDYDEVRINYDDNPLLVHTHYYEIASRVHWNIYLPGNPRPFDTYVMSDTLFFTEVRDGMWVEYFTVERMIREAFYDSGYRYGRYLVPAWVRASRNLYRGREDSLRLAAKYTSNGDWDNAYRIWENLSINADSTLAAKALNNMAVYHELDDDLDTANLMLNRSLAHDSLEVVEGYLEELETRILNRKEVIKQVR